MNHPSTVGPCLCPWCLAWRAEKRCPDCQTAIIPADWSCCWPCQQERADAAELLQRWWTP
jgi:hypothetical protein